MITMISCPNFENPKLKTGENSFAELPGADFAAFFALPVDVPTENIGAPTADAPARSDFQKNEEIEETENLPDALQLKTEPESAELHIITASPETQLPPIFPSMIISSQPPPDSLPIDSAGLIDKTETLLNKDFEMNQATVSKPDEEIENFEFSPADAAQSEIAEANENPVELLKTKIAQAYEQTNEQTNEQIKANIEFSNDLPNFFVAISKVFQTELSKVFQAENKLAKNELTENNLTAAPEVRRAEPEIFSTQNFLQPIFSSQSEPDYQPENKAENKDGNNFENKAVFSAEAETLVNQGLETGLVEILNSPEAFKINSLTPLDLSYPLIFQKTGKDEFSNRLPDFFTVMANVFKSEVSAAPEKPDFTVDFNTLGDVSAELPSVGKIDVKFAENAAINLIQPEKIVTEAENPSLEPDEVSTVNFDKFSAILSKDKASVEEGAPIPVKTRDVLAQVEPQMLYLASLTVKENEKKTMKMRLHPAELGMVEITLERGSSGNLNAHFQTESETTRRILTESINELRQSLEDSGWQIERLEITCAAFSSNEGNENDGHGKQAKNLQHAENQPNGTVSLDNKSDNNADDKNDFQRKQSNRFVSLRA